MIKGRFIGTAPNIPVIQLIVAAGQSVQKPYFVLDTGFTGDLQISPQTAEDLQLTPTAVEKVKIANGDLIDTPIAEALVSMEGAINSVSVLISNGSELAGIGLLTKFGYKATVDCKYRTVELEKMP